MAEQKQGARGAFSNLQQFLQHALDCPNPSCILPLCVNTKLKLQHSRGCKKFNCAICQEVRCLASKHSESCVVYNCRIPFCMEAKTDTHKRAHVDPSKCLDAIVIDEQSAVGSAPIGRAITTTARPQGRLESLNKSQDREPTPNLTAATPTSLVNSMDSYPPVTSNTTINHPAPFHNTSSVANSPHLRLSEKHVFQSNINEARDTANSPWYGFVEPLPASHDSTLTTATQERTTWPSLVIARENAAANTHVTATPTSPSVSVFVNSMDSYPPMTSNTTINHQAPCHNTSSVANSPHLRLSEKHVFQSNINAANDTANSPWYGFVKPLPASHDSTLTTSTQERTTWPSLVIALENAAANTHVTTDLSSPSLPTRQQNDVSVRMSHNTNKQIQQSTEQLLYTACFPTRVEACHSLPLAMGNSSNSRAAKVNRAHNTRTLVKARLIDTLCSILQLIKQTRSTEELLMCIKSLSSALGELIKKS